MIKYKWHTLLSDSNYLINYDPKCLYRNKTPGKVSMLWGREPNDRIENNKFLHVFVVLVKIKSLDFFLEIKISKQYIKF